eukprot:TRINITY_DN11946_c0_g1_i10.p1 TRINITY_DN11946_c0_g1~~TRINITY_DN11946_c0_g1_i10.p1  ORF type:complete len:370 (+),score=43.22 TRINITY_DN11946_c0_g1_i10:1766-2875(+)
MALADEVKPKRAKLDQFEQDDPDDDDDIITPAQWIAQDEAEREIERAVYGTTRDDCCSYDQGYVRRQPVHTCLTCAAANNMQTGYLCLGCAEHCHSGHEVVELWTKRNVRCDCGNSLYPDNPCTLTPNKEPTSSNKYSQNTQGLFCSCHLPYPHESIPEDVPMIQCIACEDWFHCNITINGHELLPLLEEDGSEAHAQAEFICTACTQATWAVLARYQATRVYAPEDGRIDVPRGLTPEAEGQCTRPAASDVRPSAGYYHNLRTSLCKCARCKELYQQLDVTYLLDPADSLAAYEESQRPERDAQDTQAAQQAMSTITAFTPEQQRVLATGMQQLRGMMIELHRKSANGQREITEQDVRDAFATVATQK